MDSSDIRLIEEIHRLLRTSGRRLCLAESCTGGLISHLLTGKAGASSFFDSSFVCYSNECKAEVLNLNEDVTSRYGVISEETAREMAVTVRRLRNTDFSLATTGNLGPDAMEGKEAGLVYAAVDCKGGTVSKRFTISGGRALVKMRAAMASLELLRDTISNE